MTTQEILAVKRYAEGAYPMLKNEIGSDTVWVDMLRGYSQEKVMESLRNHIKSGNKYAPTIAELIKGAEIKPKLSDLDQEILFIMQRKGVFKDENDNEVGSWNSKNRIHKAENWLSHPLRELAWPSWFSKIYQECVQIIEGKLITNRNLIGQ